MYTWGCSALDNDNHSKEVSGCGSFIISSTHGNGSIREGGSSRKRRHLSNMDINFSKQASVPSEKVGFINFFSNTYLILSFLLSLIRLVNQNEIFFSLFLSCCFNLVNLSWFYFICKYCRIPI